MTDAVLEPSQARPSRPNANLGAVDAEEIFAAFDTRIIRRFFKFLTPHRGYLVGAQSAVLVSAAAQLLFPYLIGHAVTLALIRDQGVAGLHRLLHERVRLDDAAVIIAAGAQTPTWETSSMTNASTPPAIKASRTKPASVLLAAL